MGDGKRLHNELIFLNNPFFIKIPSIFFLTLPYYTLYYPHGNENCRENRTGVQVVDFQRIMSLNFSSLGANFAAFLPCCRIFSLRERYD